MLRDKEASALYYLCRDVYTGKGRIVDAGSYLGASAWCMAHGLIERNAVLYETVQPLVCYDLFREYGAYVNGGHFMKQFVDNLEPVLPWIEIRQGDFARARWDGEPIELLFVDIAKTRPLNNHVITEFFPNLTGEGAIVFQQDFHHPFLPYIHIQMELLMDYFDILEEKADDSCIFRMRSAIPPYRIQAAVAARPVETELALLDDHIQRFSPENRRHLYLVRAVLLDRVRGRRAAQAYFKEFVEPLGEFPDDRHWAMYLGRVRTRLELAPEAAEAG